VPGPQPTFLVLGAQKSATRWLRLNLGLHPKIFTADHEIAFFSSPPRYAQGRDWYAGQFAGWDGEPIVGEATPAYMMYRQHPRRIARRIAKFNPEMRLLAVLRNPIDRAYSGFVHHLKAGRLDPQTDVLDYVSRVRPRVDPLTIISGGWYHASLKPYRRRFGDKLLVLLHDDIGEDPAAVYDRALVHVGADPGFRPPELDAARFGNLPPKESGLRAQDGGYRPLDRAQRRALYRYFADDIAKLEHMIGRDLDMWRPVVARKERVPAS
jgi:hypothetical protein